MAAKDRKPCPSLFPCEPPRGTFRSLSVPEHAEANTVLAELVLAEEPERLAAALSTSVWRMKPTDLSDLARLVISRTSSVR